MSSGTLGIIHLFRRPVIVHLSRVSGDLVALSGYDPSQHLLLAPQNIRLLMPLLKMFDRGASLSNRFLPGAELVST
jgi:hypothetical protein